MAIDLSELITLPEVKTDNTLKIDNKSILGAMVIISAFILLILKFR